MHGPPFREGRYISQLRDDAVQVRMIAWPGVVHVLSRKGPLGFQPFVR